MAVFSHLADEGLVGRFDTIYMECHYMAHANLIQAINEVGMQLRPRCGFNLQRHMLCVAGSKIHGPTTQRAPTSLKPSKRPADNVFDSQIISHLSMLLHWAHAACHCVAHDNLIDSINEVGSEGR